MVKIMGLLLQVRDSKHPKKAMNDLGADGMSSYWWFEIHTDSYTHTLTHLTHLTDFLPLFAC